MSQPVHFPECVIYNSINVIGVMSFRKKQLYIKQLIMPLEAIYPVRVEIIFKFISLKSMMMLMMMMVMTFIIIFIIIVIIVTCLRVMPHGICL